MYKNTWTGKCHEVDDVNFIRSKGVNHRDFKEVLNDLDSNYVTSVRWLSRELYKR